MRKKKTGRTRWNTRRAHLYAAKHCPACDRKRVNEAVRTNHDALTWGALTEYRLDCGHVVAQNGTVVA